MTAGAQALYRFFDMEGELLYIGITMDPGSRWRGHRGDKPWWTEVRNITVEPQPDRATALEVECAAIKRERPRYNRVHAHTPQSGRRAAQMLARADSETTARYRSRCLICDQGVLPVELYPTEGAEWLALYECCDGRWERSGR